MTWLSTALDAVMSAGWVLSALAMLGAGLLYLVKQYVLPFVVKRVESFREVVAEVDHAETEYGGLLGNPVMTGELATSLQRRDEAAKVLRDLGIRLGVTYDAIPALARAVLALVRVLPCRRAANEAGRRLNNLSNYTRPSPGDLRENDRQREILRASLRLPFRRPPRHVERPRWWSCSVQVKP